jgi:hypothetical protein
MKTIPAEVVVQNMAFIDVVTIEIIFLYVTLFKIEFFVRNPISLFSSPLHPRYCSTSCSQVTDLIF